MAFLRIETVDESGRRWEPGTNVCKVRQTRDGLWHSAVSPKGNGVIWNDIVTRDRPVLSLDTLADPVYWLNGQAVSQDVYDEHANVASTATVVAVSRAPALGAQGSAQAMRERMRRIGPPLPPPEPPAPLPAAEAPLPEGMPADWTYDAALGGYVPRDASTGGEGGEGGEDSKGSGG